MSVVIRDQFLRSVVPDAVAEPYQHVVVLQVYTRRLTQLAHKRRDVLLCPVRVKPLEDHHHLARVIGLVDNAIRAGPLPASFLLVVLLGNDFVAACAGMHDADGTGAYDDTHNNVSWQGLQGLELITTSTILVFEFEGN